MARRSFYVSIGQSLGDGQYQTATTEDGADAISALATLVADAATPTQAHVTALNTAIGRKGNVEVSFDTTAVTSLNQLKAGLAAALRQAVASGMV